MSHVPVMPACQGHELTIKEAQGLCGALGYIHHLRGSLVAGGTFQLGQLLSWGSVCNSRSMHSIHDLSCISGKNLIKSDHHHESQAGTMPVVAVVLPLAPQVMHIMPCVDCYT